MGSEATEKEDYVAELVIGAEQLNLDSAGTLQSIEGSPCMCHHARPIV
jgi:hypothetical protein